MLLVLNLFPRRHVCQATGLVRASVTGLELIYYNDGKRKSNVSQENSDQNIPKYKDIDKAESAKWSIYKKTFEDKVEVEIID